MNAVEVKGKLAERAEEVCGYLLPGGKRHGSEWVAGSVAGEPGKSLKVSLNGGKAGIWQDFASGPEDKGDLLDLWRRVRGVDFRTALDQARQWLGLPAWAGSTLPRPRIASPRLQEVPSCLRPAADETPASAHFWRELQTSIRRGRICEFEALARLRGLPVFAGLQLASDAGQLWFVEAPDGREKVTAWLLTDGSRRVAQLRRLDGKPWQGIDAKAKTLVAAGGDAAWPVGIASIGSKPFVALVEGGPDLLAAWHFAWWCGRANEIAPLALLGAGQTIHRDALALFEGRGVWTFPHADTAGADAAGRWAGQLRTAGALWVKPFNFAGYTLPDGRPVKDLNDFCAAVDLADEQEGISHD